MSEQVERGVAGAAASAEEPPVLWLKAVERRYKQAGGALEILKGADFAVWPGESVALIAPSGTGKSTLLHVAGLLEAPDAGEVYIGGTATSKLADKDRTRIRRLEIGFVYQFHHLLPEFSALENVVLPQMIRGLGQKEARTRAAELLGYLGLAERVSHRPAELSGGEQQRVAIARALVADPPMLLCDEPTGNLDSETARQVVDLLADVCQSQGKTVVVVTHHEAEVAHVATHRLRLTDGRLDA